MMDLVLRQIKAGERCQAKEIWIDLESKYGKGELTNSWFWISAWLDALGDIVPHVFLVAECDGAPVGITLITRGVKQVRGRIPVRTVHITTGGEPPEFLLWTEYRRVLVREAERAAFAAAVIDHIRASGRWWEEIVLDGFVPEEARPFLARKGFWFIRREACPTTDLATIRDNGGDVIGALGKNTRYSIRRSIRGFGEVTTERAETIDQAYDIFDELIELHQKHWHNLGQRGAFASQRYRQFHRSLLPELLERNALLLARVRSPGQTIGCIYGFIEHNHVLMYQSGLAEFEDQKLKPGLVSHALVMQQCLESGIDGYDYGYGDSRYKRELSTGERELTYAVLSRRTPKQALLRYARIRHYGKSVEPAQA